MIVYYSSGFIIGKLCVEPEITRVAPEISAILARVGKNLYLLVSVKTRVLT